MDVEVLTLAGAAAEALVQAMVSDGWTSARARIARVLSGGDPARVPAEEAELERSGQALRGNELSPSVTAGHWQGRIADLLTRHPECAGELTALLRELRSRTGGTAHVHVGGHNNGNLIIGDRNTARIHRPEPR
ncbi:unnamed protein product [[Actinomadura] parvosata subsp. kistnae]|uniref:Uncharacterized protein n=1 Tax=[Actinomadura] parvosata subsp. kistnae TaxID=1909395 RepID=A0A1U9ZUX8_9ACTN|nr:hypothetical protein [Nonomuraea sp. ATCC 55076]AQZ61729.1 hypothetical protein BKM31_09825 [Nonomuraea sp. ATCC 55076]SPL87844.1 unnamed protein product [Actinomadura parvosata subsp. kistnae]